MIDDELHAEKVRAWHKATPALREFLTEWGIFQPRYGAMTDDEEAVTVEWGVLTAIGTPYPIVLESPRDE